MRFLSRALCLAAVAALWPEFGKNALVSAAASAPPAAVKSAPPAVPTGSDKDVQVLTDSNFEQETQAVTGSTSGDWFVKFYAPWCGHCRKMAKAWEELATKLKGQINVAHLDATTNAQTAKRFSVRGFPTLVFMKDGKMYEYKGSRAVDDLYAFATGGWKSVAGKPIPPVETWFETLQSDFMLALYRIRDLALQFPLVIALLVSFGILLGLVMSCMCSYMCSESRSAHKKLSKVSKKKD